jgi:hypothetical protein
MAKIYFNKMFSGMSGRMGDFVFRTSPTGETTISRRPDMSQVKWSKAQRTQRRRFKQANLFAQAAREDPELWAYYEQEAKRLNKKPYHVAFSDYFRIDPGEGE